ncbi:hypothetical protein LPU83_pLPU83d_0601 (plasmid) [Rhizobium favelukesii]|uniref:Uncharacterized protein n=1 Tax=Rhizobium favelukesii TaxID=348824 RepID=W6RLJ8_9HYPH|nr:hypothetical protein LPU83_pLPU83d_0601 [Rhizobium favelukesii]
MMLDARTESAISVSAPLRFLVRNRRHHPLIKIDAAFAQHRFKIADTVFAVPENRPGSHLRENADT